MLVGSVILAPHVGHLGSTPADKNGELYLVNAYIPNTPGQPLQAALRAATGPREAAASPPPSSARA